VVVEGTQKIRDGAAVEAISRVAEDLAPTTDVGPHEASATPAGIRQ
jgi:hypothetical protein